MGEYKLNLEASLGFSGDLDIRIHSVEQLINQMQMPFSDQVKDWLEAHPEVLRALKIVVKNRFVPIRAISIVDNPDLNGVKQSIGIYSIDTNQDNQIKQDYLMHEEDDSFVLFTGLPRHIKRSKYVRHVSELEEKYGPDGQNFLSDHHQILDEVNPDIRPYIKSAINGLEVSHAKPSFFKRVMEFFRKLKK
jgi:hypothetical protein